LVTCCDGKVANQNTKILTNFFYGSSKKPGEQKKKSKEEEKTLAKLSSGHCRLVAKENVS